MDRKIALVTGATSGIGAAFARHYAAQGYDLIITGRREQKVNLFARELMSKHAIDVRVIIAELSDKRDTDMLLEQIKGKDIEVLVNNAGFGYNTLFQNGSMDVVRSMVEVHVMTALSLIQEVLPDMIKKVRGTIINVSSESAFLLIPGNAVYTGTKTFLKSFTEALHLDLMGTGVKVQALCPSFTLSDFHEKMGMDRSRQVNRGIIRWMTPDEVVGVSIKSLDKGKVVCIPGAHSRLLIKILSLMPKNSYYSFAYNFSKKNFAGK